MAVLTASFRRSQARTKSKPRLWPTPQLRQCLILQSTEPGQVLNRHLSRATAARFLTSCTTAGTPRYSYSITILYGGWYWPIFLLDVPRLGVEMELQLLVYTTATATPDLSGICDLHTPQTGARSDPWPAQQGQGSNLHPRGHYVEILIHWATVGTPTTCFHSWGNEGLERCFLAFCSVLPLPAQGAFLGIIFPWSSLPWNCKTTDTLPILFPCCKSICALNIKRIGSHTTPLNQFLTPWRSCHPAEKAWLREISDWPKFTQRLSTTSGTLPLSVFSVSTTPSCYISDALFLLPKTDALAEMWQYWTMLWKIHQILNTQTKTGFKKLPRILSHF